MNRLLVLASLLWTGISLFTQLISAWGGGRKTSAVRSGDPWRGVVYNFTSTMLPSRKETASHNPGNFVAGVIMHVGACLSILQIVLVSLLNHHFSIPILFPAILLAGMTASAYLLLHRIRKTDLAAISVPDDYIASVMTLLLMCVAFLNEINSISHSQLTAFAILFFIYFPLGKLRHSVFFFAARYDLGKRLGYRGTYPTRGQSLSQHGDRSDERHS